MTATISSKRIMCSGCAVNITKILSGAKGVRSVSVDVPSKQVTVVFDEALTNVDTLKQTITDAGYPADN